MRRKLSPPTMARGRPRRRTGTMPAACRTTRPRWMSCRALAPNMGAVSLVVGWFGDDLRCGETKIMPGVEIAKKDTYPETWSVDGVSRANAHLLSGVNGIPAYGGTPSDESVVEAIQDLKARGL